MANIIVACDNNFGYSVDTACVNTFCEKLNAAGHTAKNVGRGPNTTQHYSKTHNCDIMVQIAAGKCIGTFVDFVLGCTRGYYHAKKFSIPYWKNEESVMTWKAKQAWDDHFSRQSDIAPYIGKTLPECYEKHKDIAIFSHGNTAEEMANMFLKNLNGGSATSTDDAASQPAGSSCMDLIKQVCTDWDPYGVDLDLKGDTVRIQKTNPNNTAPLSKSNIVSNSINYTDYDRNTPNVNGSAKDQFLIDRFGQVPLETEVTDQQQVVLQMAQRGHNHSIDLKTIINKNIGVGSWVTLDLPELGLEKRKYYVSKMGYQEERVTSLTLDVAPPSLYVEISEETTDTTEGETTDEESTADEAN